MSKSMIQVAASSFPSALFDRRRMLLGLAAASTAAAAPVAVVAATSAPAESAALIGLGDKSAALVSAYRAAVSEREAIVAAWAAQWPSVPTVIQTRSELGQVAYGFEGEWPDPYEKYHTADYFTRRAAEMREPRKFRKGTNPLTIVKRAADMEKYAQEAEGRAALSEMYCAERRRIREASGIRPAQIKEDEAREALIRHVASIMEMEPVTMAGAIVQAEALEALSAVPTLQRGRMSVEFLQTLPAWGERLAASILRIARSAA